MIRNILRNYMTKQKVRNVRGRLDSHGGLILREVISALLERMSSSHTVSKRYLSSVDNIVARCAPAASTVQVLLLTPTFHVSWCP
jgi:hypothetical protein